MYCMRALTSARVPLGSCPTPSSMPLLHGHAAHLWQERGSHSCCRPCNAIAGIWLCGSRFSTRHARLWRFARFLPHLTRPWPRIVHSCYTASMPLFAVRNACLSSIGACPPRCCYCEPRQPPQCAGMNERGHVALPVPFYMAPLIELRRSVGAQCCCATSLEGSFALSLSTSAYSLVQCPCRKPTWPSSSPRMYVCLQMRMLLMVARGSRGTRAVRWRALSLLLPLLAWDMVARLREWVDTRVTCHMCDKAWACRLSFHVFAWLLPYLARPCMYASTHVACTSLPAGQHWPCNSRLREHSDNMHFTNTHQLYPRATIPLPTVEGG